MRKKREAPSEGQLELKFEPEVSSAEPLPTIGSNVVRVKFGAQKSVSLNGSKKDQALIERILQNAQKLKW